MSSTTNIRDWPHAPAHRLSEAGAYIITSATCGKERFFHSPNRLTFLTNTILESADDFGFTLQAWAIFPNHYHVIVETPNAKLLKNFVGKVHTTTTRRANEADHHLQRKVWFQYWETHLTFPKSFLARLNYVHSNPVRHQLVQRPEHYPWCSAAWFERKAPRSLYNTVMNFPCDQLNVPDNFDCAPLVQTTAT